MARIIVIGGTGFYGAVVVTHLARIADAKVVVASRRPPANGLCVDLDEPQSLAALQGAEVVVNCSDAVHAPPDRAIAYCQLHHIPWVEMGAWAPATGRLLALPALGAPVVIGAGVFPGWSTSLAHHLVQSRSTPVQQLHVGVRISPLSGAGPANCELMTQMLETPSLQVQEGCIVEGPPLAGTRKLAYSHDAEATYTEVGLPDAHLLAHLTEVPHITTSLAVSPAILRYNFRLLATLTAWAGPLRPLMRWVTWWLLRLSRGFLLRNVESPVHLTAVAHAGSESQVALLAFPEGREATALGVAAVVDALLARETPLKPGMYTCAEIEPLPQLLTRAQKLRKPGRTGELAVVYRDT